MNKFIVLATITCLLVACESKEKKSLAVTATAYNSLPEQTTREGAAVTAWGDTLEPGMKCIAVSRDLIDSGLTKNTEVYIEGLEGTYRVNDKMNKRWTQKIDIYMGLDKEKALEWGKKEVQISWVPVEKE